MVETQRPPEASSWTARHRVAFALWSNGLAAVRLTGEGRSNYRFVQGLDESVRLIDLWTSLAPASEDLAAANLMGRGYGTEYVLQVPSSDRDAGLELRGSVPEYILPGRERIAVTPLGVQVMNTEKERDKLVLSQGTGFLMGLSAWYIVGWAWREALDSERVEFLDVEPAPSLGMIALERQLNDWNYEVGVR